ncbi:MAG: phospholipase D-like domain-containing protein [Phenylobacterium sp.]|uniref:phospholipase D-like domain-containing protein n=1 Tax=Phenylobacterium sp. TaxID=1871053 RepID=UPI0027236930|nr:phospholipase D-like domain-containing protein [Phenylobacterium sp.]MDO9249729.1 phospholipase D-like domain-containing protein [Phenylobacterium sp.]MDP3634366.1 phospholipase D-like domain-containing protein [Phenylobacterium sp.]
MSVLKPGDTVWRTGRANRAAFLIDTEAYYTAVYEALRKAKRSVLLLGWGFDPRTRLFPDGQETADDPDEAGRILVELARARPELDIRLLIWKSALPIAASQEFFPHKARKWFEKTGVKFRLDDAVPMGACHHQKLLVVDDKLAICASGDICVDRWDTPGHRDHEPRRIMPDQECHAPRHEVMLMVDGPVAKDLGDLARERWRRATKEVVAPPPELEGDPWPAHVPAHLLDMDVGIARTMPAWRHEPQVEEIRRLTHASILAARDVIYLENQYFTSPLIAEALATRLAEPNGPEIVLISTGASPSWFDQLTMDRARSNMLWRLRSADIFGRFRAFYPITPGGTKIIVHSKSTIIDDKIARVGSANLNNRSGGFDTELELAIEATTERAQLNIAAFRDRSIGHFLGYTGDAVAKARQERGGLIAGIDALNREGRLSPVLAMKMTAFGEFVAAYHLGDPVNVSDSWRPGRRRDRLYAEARALGEGGIFESRNWRAPVKKPRNP